MLHWQLHECDKIEIHEVQSEVVVATGIRFTIDVILSNDDKLHTAIAKITTSNCTTHKSVSKFILYPQYYRKLSSRFCSASTGKGDHLESSPQISFLFRTEMDYYEHWMTRNHVDIVEEEN